MRRLGRILVNALTVLSLLLCAAAVALWVRSYPYGSDGGDSAGDLLRWHWFETRDDRRVELCDVALTSVGGRVRMDRSRELLRAGHDRDSARSFHGPEGFRWSRWYYARDRLQPPPSGRGRVTRQAGAYGFHLYDTVKDESPAGRYRDRGVILPLWFLTLVFATLPTLAARRAYGRRRRRRRARAGQCQACGYDLRATPDKCPECGAVPAVDSTVPAPTPAARPGGPA